VLEKLGHGQFGEVSHRKYWLEIFYWRVWCLNSHWLQFVLSVI
jgi:hypothetical protein